METKRENKASIIPTGSSSLSKANNSIAVTKKILSESPYKYHGDFKGEKIWEKQLLNDLTDFPKLKFVGNYLLLSHGANVFLYDRINFNLIFKKDDSHGYGAVTADHYYIYQIINDEGIYVEDKDRIIIRKISLSDFSITENIDYNWDGPLNHVLLTSDNEYLISYGNISGWKPPIRIIDPSNLKVVKILDTTKDFDFAYANNAEICITKTFMNEFNGNKEQRIFYLINFLSGEMTNQFILTANREKHISYYLNEQQEPHLISYLPSDSGWEYISKYHQFALFKPNSGRQALIFDASTGAFIKEMSVPLYVSKNISDDFVNFGYDDISVNVYDSITYKLVVEYLEAGGDTIFDSIERCFYTIDGYGALHKWK